MTSQPGQQTIVLHILSSISRSKGNQKMKFDQLIELTWETFFSKNHAQNMIEKLVRDPFLEN